VETTEDTIVFSGVTNTEFAAEIKGRKVLDVKRLGKVFYMVLEREGRMPVMHFGMTGMVQVKGQEPTWYQRRPKEVGDEWPPKWMKFIIRIAATDDLPAVQIAFRDARRLARIRLCAKPLEELPISELGFDPLLSMPSVEDFSPLVKKRNCPIKALLLDQSFSAGVGNWVADEILFHARIHPERKASSLSDAELELMHEKTVYVCQTAVDVQADSSKFPSDWLFPHRWGKGKKEKTAPLLLPDGEVAKIKWITVGGRTSAVVEQVQKLTGGAGTATKKRKRGKEEDDSSDLTELSDVAETADRAEVVRQTKRRKPSAREGDNKPKGDSAANKSPKRSRKGADVGSTPGVGSSRRSARTDKSRQDLADE